MKLLISGSRNISEFDLSPYILSEVDAIICGGADGIDTIAESYADAHRLSKHVVRPSLYLHGRTASLKRIEEMVELADSVLIISDGDSKDTLYTLGYAKRKNKPLTLITL